MTFNQLAICFHSEWLFIYAFAQGSKKAEGAAEEMEIAALASLTQLLFMSPMY